MITSSNFCIRFLPLVDMKALNVIEPFRVISQVLKSATEAASMLLRIDDVVSAKGTKDMKPPGPPRGMGPEDY